MRFDVALVDEVDLLGEEFVCGLGRLLLQVFVVEDRALSEILDLDQAPLRVQIDKVRFVFLLNVLKERARFATEREIDLACGREGDRGHCNVGRLGLLVALVVHLNLDLLRFNRLKLALIRVFKRDVILVLRHWL